MQGGFRSFAPVNVGEEVDVKIEAVGEKGDGIAKVKGFVLFIPNVKEGDEVKVRITKVLRKVGFADVVGDASGPIGDSSEGGVQEIEEEAPAEPAPEDSEDFGEETTASEAAEEPEKKE